MVSFDHRDAGTPEAAWREGVAALPALRPREWGPGTVLLGLVAHPDDETLGASALIRAALRGGSDVHLLVATAGEASHPESPTHSPEDLVRLRRAEMDHAAAALAADLRPAEGVVPGALTWEPLGLPDGGLPARADDLAAALEAELARRAAAGDAVVLVSHDPEDGHGDHEAAGAVTAAAAAERHLPLHSFPLWFWHWGDPADLPARRLRALPLHPGDAEARAAALAAHATQVAPLSDAPGDEAILPPRMVEHFSRDVETHRYSGPDDADAARASAVFDRLYREHEDPWRYLTSPYEARKRDLTLAALPRPRYGTVVEAGASIGVLTARLADRADRVVGLEASEVAVERAAARLADVPGAEVRHAVLPTGWPADLAGPDAVDLVVASEIGYFLQPEELDALLDAADAALAPDGELLLCHWRHPVEGWPLDGDDVHARVAADPRWRTVGEHVEADMRITVHARAAAATHAVVVVPAKDEAALLPGGLDALSAALDRWEQHRGQGSALAVVAVPAQDAPTLAAAARARAEDPRLHVLELPEAPGGVGRARAAAAHRGRELFAHVPAARLWLASTDADTRVGPGWLAGQAAIAAEARPDGQALVLGTVDLETAGDPADPAGGEVTDPGPGAVGLAAAWRADYRHEEGHPHVHGANLGLPWALYEAVGGFAPVREHEDVRLAAAVRALGPDRATATDRVRVSTSDRLTGRTPGGFAGFLRDLAGH